LSLDRYQDDPEALLSFALSTHAPAAAAAAAANDAALPMANTDDVVFVRE
jgi:hypothetical protein